MAELTPLFQDVDNVYSGNELGLPYRDIISEGIVGAGDLLVSESAPQGMSVAVAAGVVWVLGDTNPDEQPCYRCRLDASKTLIVPAADPSNARIDLVVAQVHDATFDTSNQWSWSVSYVQGTPAANPVAPATPASAVVLAQVHVGAAAGAITASDITDVRPKAAVGSGEASGAPASIPGELKVWPSTSLPDVTYGTWVWADGAAYLATDYEEAFANIATAWDTHNGKAQPAAGYRRVPDMRGAVPVGLDSMGQGAAGRTGRASAMAAAFGAEYHALSVNEMPAHNHGGSTGGPNIQVAESTSTGEIAFANQNGDMSGGSTQHTHSIASQGGGAQHENMPPANAVGWIVFLG